MEKKKYSYNLELELVTFLETISKHYDISISKMVRIAVIEKLNSSKDLLDKKTNSIVLIYYNNIKKWIYDKEKLKLTSQRTEVMGQRMKEIRKEIDQNTDEEEYKQ